jgi:hypothetical protein
LEDEEADAALASALIPEAADIDEGDEAPPARIGP